MNISAVMHARDQLYQWIDELPPRQLVLIHQLVEELLSGERDDTTYLLSSEAMKERLLAARDSSEGMPYEVVREELGI